MIPDHVALPIEEIQRRLGDRSVPVYYYGGHPVLDIAEGAVVAGVMVGRAIVAAMSTPPGSGDWTKEPHATRRMYAEQAVRKLLLVPEHSIDWMQDTKNPVAVRRLLDWAPGGYLHSLDCWRNASSVDDAKCKCWSPGLSFVDSKADDKRTWFGHCRVCGVKQDHNSCPHWQGRL